jgi:hypothetical protein
MQFSPISVGDAVDAWVQNQIEEAAAREILYENGIKDADATILHNTRGRPPGPAELIEMARRGKIPVKGRGPDAISLEQGIYESASKDKWEPVYEALMEYLPPPRTVTAMLRSGSLTEAEALDIFRKSGLSEHLAAAYVANAHHQTTHASRELTKADVLTLYAEGVFSREQAAGELTNLAYPAPVIEFELEAADFRRIKGLIDKAVSRVHSLYVAHKIPEQVVVDSLGQLKVPAAQITALMQVWSLEAADNVKVLSPAEIGHAAKLGILTEQTAFDMLQVEGYQPHDAWVRLGLALGAASSLPEP